MWNQYHAVQAKIGWLILTHFNILKCEGFGNPPLIHELKSYFNSCIYFYFEIYLYFFKIVIIHHTFPMQDNKYLFYLFVFIFIPFLHFIPFLFYSVSHSLSASRIPALVWVLQ